MKRKRNHNHNPTNQQIDRISDLPESIRNHIISFLPMEDSIKTSILSKQWRNVCSSLSNLNFDQKHFQKKTGSKFGFLDSVHQLITCRDGSSLERFNLTIDLDDDSVLSYFGAWIDFALRYNVKELSFSVSLGKLTLPCSRFSSRMLVYLCLKNIGLSSSHMAMVNGYPMLKKLELERIRWSDDEQTNQLIANCPLLETLVMLRCTWDVSKVIRISNPNLRRIMLGPTSITQEVKISCNNLREYRYIGNPPDISLKSLSSLVWAMFYFFPFCTRTTKISQKDVILRVTKLFTGLQDVRRLFLENFSIEILSRDRDLLSKSKSSFCYLKELNMIVFPTTNQLQFVASLVTICPNLYILCITFKVVLEYAQEAHVINVEGYFQPQKLSELGTLEYIYIRDFSGSENELYLIEHLLGNAKILKHLSVTCSKELSRDAQKQGIVDDKIQQFVKVSPLQQYCMSK